MKTRILSLVVAVVAATLSAWAYVDVYFSSVPSAVTSGQSYYVGAELYAPNGGDLYIYKNNAYFTQNSGYDIVTAGSSTSDTGAQTVEYIAEGWDWYEGYSDFDYATVTVASASNQPPTATVEVDGYSSGATIVRPYGGSVSVTVRYKATDPNGNLTGIRPQVLDPLNTLSNNNGAFVSTGGSSAEIAWTVTLNKDGDWYFWTDATDSVIAPSYVDSGAWQSGFRIRVVEESRPPSAPVATVWANTSSLYTGQSAQIYVRGQDADGNVRYFNLDQISPLDCFYGPGDSFVSSQQPNNGAWDLGSGTGDYTRTVTMLFDKPGTYVWRGAVNDGSGWVYSASNHTITVPNRDPSVSLQILDAGQNVISPDGNGRARVPINSNFYIRVTGADPDGRLMTLYSRLSNPAGTATDYQQVSVSGASASYTFGPFNPGTTTGVWDVWGHAQDLDAGGYQWSGNGWMGSHAPDVEVYVPNGAPTGSWHTLPPSPLYIGTGFTARAAGHDDNGNLTQVTVDVSINGGAWTPHAHNAGGNGYDHVSDNNLLVAGAIGTTYQFRYYVADSDGANTGWQYSAVYTVGNRAPSGSFTVNGVAGDSSITFGQAISVASTASDPDGNLSVHSFWWDQGSGLTWTHPIITWSYPPNSDGWYNLSLGADGYGVSGGSSSRSFDFRPTKAAVFAFHAAAGDADNSVSLGVHYLTVNKAAPVITGWSSQSRAGIGTFAWAPSLSNPHSGAVAQPTGGLTYSVVGASGSGASPTSGAVSPSTSFGLGTYTIRATYGGDANYSANSWDVTFTVENTAPWVAFDGISGDGAYPNYGYVNSTMSFWGRAGDADGNLSHVLIYVDGTYRATVPVDSSGNWSWSATRASLGLAYGNHTAQAFARDIPGLEAGSGIPSFEIRNTAPQYTAWSVNGNAADFSIELGQALNISASVADVDGNLSHHGLLVLNPGGVWQQPIGVDYTWWGGFSPSAMWVGISQPAGNTVSSGSANTVSGTFVPPYCGRWVPHSNASDGSSFSPTAPGLSVDVLSVRPAISGWANLSRAGAGTLDASPVLSNPHSAAVVQPTGGLTYTVVGASAGATPASGTITLGSTVFSTGTFTIRASYSGDGNYQAAYWDVTFSVVNRPPSNVSMGTSKSTYVFGEPITVTARATDPDGDLVAHHYVVSSSLGFPSSNWEGAAPNGGVWRHFISASFGRTADGTSSVVLYDHNYGLGYNLPPATYYLTLDSEDSVPQWTYDPNSVMATFAVQKATPVGGFSARSLGSGGAYVVQAADLNATFSNPHSGAVTAPTGSVTYSIVSGGSGQVTAGTALPSGSYVIRASYSGDGNYNAASVDAAWNVTSQPSVSAEFVGTNAIQFGQTLTARYAGTAPNGNLAYLMYRIGDPAAVLVSSSQTLASQDSGGWGIGGTLSYNASSVTSDIVFRPGAVGDFTIWAHARTTLWDGTSANANGDATISNVGFQVQKATPVGSFAARSLGAGGTYTVQAGDLNAAFGNPHSGAVAAPTGSVTYSIVAGGSGAVVAGTSLAPGAYTVRASYPGDDRYNASSVDAIWTVAAPQTYSLTVNNGSGGAGAYVAGASVTISANAPASGYIFSAWVIESGPGVLADPNASTTTLTMGAGNSTVSATYVPIGGGVELKVHRPYAN